MKIFQLFLIITTLVISSISYANTKYHQSQIHTTLNQIIALTKEGEQMNVKKTAQVFGEPELYGNAVYDGRENDTTLRHYYEFARMNSPLKSVRYGTWLDMGAGFHYIQGMVEYEFRPEFCPSVSDYEKVTGNKAMTLQVPNSPDLITGRGSSYTAYSIDINKDKSLWVVGCRVSVSSEAKLS